MADSGEMRVSDADREAVAERLRTAQDEGRLTLAEYDERLRAAYASVTFNELKPLTADLPKTKSAEKKRVELKKSRRHQMAKEWSGFANIAVLMIGIWLVTSIAAGAPVFFWPIFPLGFWGAVLVGQMLFEVNGGCHGEGGGSEGGESKDKAA